MAFPIFLWGLGAAGAAAATLITKAFLDDDTNSMQGQSTPPGRKEPVERGTGNPAQSVIDPFYKLRAYLQQHDVKCDARFNRRLAVLQTGAPEKRTELMELCGSRFEETQAMAELGKEVRTAKVRARKAEKALVLLKEAVDSCCLNVNGKEISE